MSRVIKLHTPAGRVRVLRKSKNHHNEQQRSVDVAEALPVFDEESQGVGEESAASSASDDVGTNVMSVEQRLKDEYKAGFDEGRRFTEKMLCDELAAKLLESQNIIEMLVINIKQEYKRLQTSAEHNVVKLSLAIAERVVKREVIFESELVLRQIHEATKRVIGVERIKLRVNPKDEDYVRDHRAQILTTTDAARELIIESDDTIARGGCILESDSGNVDALIATQLERIEAAILGEQGEK